MTHEVDIRGAAEAHTNLTVFHMIERMMEGSFLHGTSANHTAAKIIKLCQVEQQLQLRAFDRFKKVH